MRVDAVLRSTETSRRGPHRLRGGLREEPHDVRVVERSGRFEQQLAQERLLVGVAQLQQADVRGDVEQSLDGRQPTGDDKTDRHPLDAQQQHARDGAVATLRAHELEAPRHQHLHQPDEE